MSAQPFQQLLVYLKPSPVSRWGAVVSSALSGLLLLAFVPLLFLFVDLLQHEGRLRDWDQFRSEDQQRIRETLGSQALADREPTLAWIYQADILRNRVNSEAAERYFPAEATRPRNEALGILPTIVRLENSWTCTPLAWLARWNPWMWHNGLYLTGLLILSAGLLILRLILQNLGSYLAQSAAIDATTRLRRGIYAHSLRLGTLATSVEAQQDAGQIMSRSCEHLCEGYAAWLSTRIRGPIILLGSMMLLLVIHLWLGIALLLLGSAVWLIIGQTTTWFRREARYAQRRSESRLGILRENMSLMLLIKSYLMERYNQSRIERHLRELSRAGKKRARAEIFSKPLLYAAIAITGLILAYLAGRVVLGGQLSLAGFAAIGLTLAFAVFGLNRSVQASVRIRRGIAAATQIDEFLERRADAAQPIDAEFLKPMTKSLDFVEVSYREPGTGRMILDGVSFSVAPGMRAAIICSQDAEADILPLLMTRFVETTGGEIRIDGKNTRWVTFESLRTQIALVRQDTLLFSDTVTNNIGCGEAGFTLPQIIEAAKKAHAHQFIQALPYGYETPLGDGGVSLRPGEQFRIALARAILRDPSILVIEEPLEPYDADSTALIADTLTRIQPQRTILILARRGSTIRASDRYVLLRAGKIAGSGSPDQLRGASEVHQALSARN